MTLPALANHLLQSTIFAAAAGLLTIALRHNRAATRYWLWLAASIKFLIPSSLFVALGHRLSGPGVPPVTQPVAAVALRTMSLPFGEAIPSSTTIVNAPSPLPQLLVAVWVCGCGAVLISWCVRWRRVAGLLSASRPICAGREFEAMRRIAAGSPVKMVSSRSSMEPGVFGILRPVLILPEGISENLPDAELEAVLAHELCHVRRRDNFTAALHTLVTGLFWFHPLVWWIGAKLFDERERACDEAAVQAGREPETYAAAILRVCRLYAAPPPDCVAGITGSDLRNRIERIMANPTLAGLSAVKKLLLATAGVVAIAVPLAIGLFTAPPGVAQALTGPSFEVASVKPAVPSQFHRAQPQEDYGGEPGRVNYKDITVHELIQHAYNVREDQISGPEWLNSDRFDVAAKPPADTARGTYAAMLQRLLADRFGLILHKEAKDTAVYSLVMGKQAKLRKPGPEDHPARILSVQNGQMHLDATATTMPGFVDFLLSMARLDRPVVDGTGLAGQFNFSLEWLPERPFTMNGVTAGGESSNGASFFTAVQEQLGLKLESQRALVDRLVVDHCDRTPTGN